MTTGKKKTEKSDIVLFLGNARDGEYEWFCENGIKIGIILDTNNAKNVGDLTKFEFVEPFNFKDDISNLFALMDKILISYNINCLLYAREFYMRHTVVLCEKYCFQGITNEVAENSLNKQKMRKLFMESLGPEATAKYCAVNTPKDIDNFIKSVSLPIIIKPSNLYASYFVDIIWDKSEIVPAFNKTKAGILNYYKRSITKADQILLQVEEYLQGSVHSVDCVADSDGDVYPTPVIDILTARDIGINDFHHYARSTPSMLNPEQQLAVQQLAISAVKSLNFKNSLAHVEMVFTKTGPKLLEVGAKPGGNRGRMLRKAYSINLVGAYAKMLQGQPFLDELEIKSKRAFAFLRPLSEKQGTFQRFNKLDRITNLTTYYDHRISIEPGVKVGLAKDGYMHFLTIELHNEDIHKILADIEYLSKQNDLFIVNE